MRMLKALFTPVFHVYIEILIALPLLYAIGGLLLETPMVYVYIGEIFLAATLGVLTRKLIRIPFLQIALGLGLCLTMVASFAIVKENGPLVEKSLGYYKYYVEEYDGSMAYILPGFMAILAFFRGKSHAHSAWDSVMPAGLHLILFAVTLIVLAVANFANALAPYAVDIMILGSIAIIASLFSMNSQKIKDISEYNKTHSEASTFAFSKNGFPEQSVDHYYPHHRTVGIPGRR